VKKLFLVDALNVLFRNYYAIGPMTNPQGASTNALYGFIRSIYKLINDFSTDHLIAVFDGPDSKKDRVAIYKEYKSHRAAMPEDLFYQLEKALEFCQIAGIPFLQAPGVEADDAIGSIAKWADKKGIDTFICTSDKDLCQLVSDHVFIVHIHKENSIVDKQKVQELYGITPEQIPDYLGLIGDASDNIPGLEGFGPKTAAALLQEFHSMENLLAHPEKVKGDKKQQVLREGKEIALISKQLATINLAVDFPHEETFFALRQPEIEKVKAFYHEMHFMSLLREIDDTQLSTHSKPVAALPEQAVDYTLVDDVTSLQNLVDELMQESEICFDTETTDIKPMRARMVGISFCVQPTKAWYIPLNGELGAARVIQALKPLFGNQAIGFCGHNIKYDLHVLLNEGLPLPRVSFDTMIASYLLSPQNPRHNLDHLALEKFGKVKIPIEELIGKGKKQINMYDVPIEKVSEYCCEDVDYTCRLKELFKKQIAELELTTVLETIELPLIPVLLGMERCGIYVDPKKLETMSTELARQLKLLEEEIILAAGESFNLNSPKQLGHILFEKLKIVPPKKSKPAFSTAAEVLETIKDQSPIVAKILTYRALEKLRSTYVDSLPDEVLPATQRIHCTFNQSVAATGRLSCQDPNLQNIPVRSEEGRKIREAFRPQNPGWSFISADYSQVELRLLAHLSEDPALSKAFNDGEDVHAYTASLVYNVPLNAVTAEMRQNAKAVNFGIVYGQQAFGLSQQLGIAFNEASAFIETYFQRYKKVKEYLEFCKESARTTGGAITLTGRKRPIPEILSKNPMLRAAAERLAINTPLQGTAADLIKIAMLQIDQWLHQNKEAGMMILQIHDELVFEVPDAHINKVETAVKHLMENVFSLNVPLLVSISIGKNWGEC
jgi:DNA polymerase-1